MSQRQKQHLGRSEGDESQIPGRDVQSEEDLAMEGKPVRRDEPSDDAVEKPGSSRGGALDGE